MKDPECEEKLETLLEFSEGVRRAVDSCPDWLGWTLDQGTVPFRGLGRLRIDLRGFLVEASHFSEKWEKLRRFKRRELLRIAFRDWLGGSIQESLTELSQLADLCLNTAARLAWDQTVMERGHPGGSYVVVGLGQLAGSEPSYEDSLDLLLLYSPEGELPNGFSRHAWFEHWARLLLEGLSEETSEGRLFKMVSRPIQGGAASGLTQSLESLGSVLVSSVPLDRRLALIRWRRVAGDEEMAYELGQKLLPFCYPHTVDECLLSEVACLQRRCVLPEETSGSISVTMATDSLAAIEFTLQCLQFFHGSHHPMAQVPGTVKALEALGRAGVAPAGAVDDLRAAYRFLRKLEHRLQMVSFRAGTIPASEEERWPLVKTLGFPTLENFDKTCEDHCQKAKGWSCHLVGVA